MELTGEEKKMQMLFSELRLADEQAAPSFSATWNRAHARSFRAQRAFNLSFALATALLVCALISLAWWSTRWQRRQPNAVAVINSSTPPTPAPVLSGTDEKNPATLAGKHSFANHRTRGVKLAARHQLTLLAADKNAVRQATAISNWQSPTASLLSSQSEGLIKSLPELNENSKELKSFLPTTPK